MVNYKNFKQELVKKTVECNNTKCVIVGVGGKAFKLGIKAPTGFSKKSELSTFFVNINDMSPEFKDQVDSLLPKEDPLKEEKDDFLDMLD